MKKVLPFMLFFLMLFGKPPAAQDSTVGEPGKEKKKQDGLAQEVYEYEHFSFMYIDNSRAERGDGLTGAAKEIIDSLGKMMSKADDARIFVYGSNGITPEICDDAKKVLKSIEKITEGENTQHPDDKYLERDQIRNALYATPFVVTRDITLDYFVTEYFIKSLLKDDASVLFASLATEMRYILSGKQVPVKINVHFTNKSGEVKKEILQAALNFHNPDTNLIVHTIPLN